MTLRDEVSSHDHGNCELCDEIESRLVECEEALEVVPLIEAALRDAEQRGREEKEALSTLGLAITECLADSSCSAFIAQELETALRIIATPTVKSSLHGRAIP